MPSKNNGCQFINILLLSMLFAETMARSNLEILMPKPNELHQADLFMKGLLTSSNEDSKLNNMKKYHRSQHNYLSKWPALRDLVSILDYDDTTDMEENNEDSNVKFLERLQELAATTSEVYGKESHNGFFNKMPISLKSLKSLSSNQLKFKDHNVKKNAQYMSPCHFKICNMGRKRNALLPTDY